MSVLPWSAVCLLLLLSEGLVSAAPRGSLFIIGGGERSAAMMNHFLDLAGGPGRAVILVLPMASSVPDTAGLEQAEEFRNLGARSAAFAVISREMAERTPPDRWLRGVTGVFFSGGDQSRLTAAILHTPLHRALLEMYEGGAVIGGTSAGAAVMSAVMITGDERRPRDSTSSFTTIAKGNVVTTEGFGFVTNMIIDQHFLARRRNNRLISVVLEHPDLLGVGIDESTVLVVSPGELCSVTGSGSVLLFDASGADQIQSDGSGNLSARGVVMHVLTEGGGFDRKTRTVMRAGR
jgi:cyanophycinase